MSYADTAKRVMEGANYRGVARTQMVAPVQGVADQMIMDKRESLTVRLEWSLRHRKFNL